MKKASKPAKATAVSAPKLKAKRKLVIDTSDFERTPSTQLVSRETSPMTKPAAAPGAMPILSTVADAEVVIVVVAFPISSV